ncbi:MAG TPA: glycosyltransferase [Bacillota bacterium]|nr:glycosyltransferase [Bacillota bacterium]
MILAPRHPERAEEVAGLLQGAGLDYVRRSVGGSDYSPSVLLLDTFGELGLAYAVGEVILVGGSLVEIGGHNVLEAAVQSKPVLYGPYMHKTRESKRLLEEVDAGFTVKDADELVATVKELVADPQLYQKRAAAARRAVLVNKGAAARTAQVAAALVEDITD